ASNNSRAARPPLLDSRLQMSCMVRPSWVSSSSLLVAQPARTSMASIMAVHPALLWSVEILCMGASDAVIDPATLGVVVDVEGLFDVHGHLGTGCHIDRREGLPVELVDPLRHFLHAARQNAA